MRGQAFECLCVEHILYRHFGTVIDGCEQVRETDLVLDFRAEFEPSEVEVHAEADGDEIVESVEQDGFFAVAGDVVVNTPTGDDVGSVVLFAVGGELYIDGYGDGYGEDVYLIAVVRTLDGIAGLGLVGDGAGGKFQSRSEAEIDVLAEPDVCDKSYLEARYEVADAGMVYLAVDLLFRIGHAEAHQVKT